MNTPAPQQQTDYLAGLGLQRAPFLDQIDDLFFYADPQLVQRLDLLQHLIQFGDMLLGVSGPAGSGKSTLLPQLLRRGGTTWRSCRLNGGQIQQPGDLLTQLADGFGMDRNATPERFRADLLRLCQTLRHTGQIPVVVIDDAQLLPDPALKTLLELCGDARSTLKQLRVVLFSEPGLEQRLSQSGLHSPLQPLLHNLDLPRFDDHQTAAYLMYRLAVAGYSGESPFSPTEIRALHKSADGLPGKLNVLAHEALMERASRVVTRRNAATAKSVGRRPLLVAGMAAGVLILGALGGYLFTRSPDETAIEVPSTTGSAPQPKTKPALEAPATATAAPETENALEAEPAAARTEAAAPAPEADQTGEPTPTDQPTAVTPAAPGTAALAAEPAPAGTQIQSPPTPETSVGMAGQTPTAPAPAAAPAEEKTAPATVEQPPAAQTATTPPAAQPDAAAPLATGPAAPTEPKPESQVATPSAATVEPPQQAEAAQTPPAADTLASKGTAKPVPPPPPLNLPAGVLQADWLLERPPGHFALQLLAVRQPDSLRGYLRDHTIPAPVAVFRARLKGSDWYVLVQGDYPSMNAARTAVAELPAAVRRTKPWPRSFVSIHTDIRKTAP